MYRGERAEPGQTALIVVDMENDFVAPGAPLETPAGRAMLPHLKRALACCREHGIPVIYTTHAHRAGGCDLGLLAHDPRIGRGDALVAGSPGAAIFPETAPRRRRNRDHEAPLQRLLRHRSGDHPARSRRDHGGDHGVTTENCCHATARDAFFRDYRVIFLSDATATSDYPDLGYGSMAAGEVHCATLIILVRDTADVVTTETFIARVAPSPDVEQRLAADLTDDIAQAARPAALVA